MSEKERVLEFARRRSRNGKFVTPFMCGAFPFPNVQYAQAERILKELVSEGLVRIKLGYYTNACRTLYVATPNNQPA